MRDRDIYYYLDIASDVVCAAATALLIVVLAEVAAELIWNVNLFGWLADWYARHQQAQAELAQLRQMWGE